MSIAAPPPAALSARSPFGPSAMRTEMLFLAGAAAALLLYRVVPAALWLSPFVLCAAYVFLRLRALSRADRLWLGGCAAAGFLLQVVVSLARQPYDPVHGPTDWFDDQAYFAGAKAISEAWRSGFFPELSRKGALPYLGTLHTGYERVLASLFYVAGPRVWLGLGANALCAALLPVLCFFLSASLFASEAPGCPGDDRTRRRGFLLRHLNAPRAAALLCVLYPSVYYWGSLLLKDLFLATLFTLSLWLLVDLYRFRSPAVAVLFLLAFVWTAIFRNYAALSLLAAGFVYAFAGLRRSAIVWGLAWCLVALFALRYTDTGGRYLDQLLNSLASLLPPDLRTPRGLMTHFAEALPRMLFSPYAWVRAQTDQPLYAQYPGMWYLYLLIYPMALAGLVQAVRTDHRPSILPVTAVLAGAFVLLAAYGGNAPRQRLYLEIVAIVYAGLGLCAGRRRQAFAFTYTVIILFAASQLLRLYMRR